MNRPISGFTVIALVFSALSLFGADSIAWWHGYCSKCAYQTEKTRGLKPEAQACPYEGANGVKCDGLITFRQCRAPDESNPVASNPVGKQDKQREAKVKRVTKEYARRMRIPTNRYSPSYELLQIFVNKHLDEHPEKNLGEMWVAEQRQEQQREKWSDLSPDALRRLRVEANPAPTDYQLYARRCTKCGEDLGRAQCLKHEDPYKHILGSCRRCSSDKHIIMTPISN